jgi:hypothetical protein
VSLNRRGGGGGRGQGRPFSGSVGCGSESIFESSADEVSSGFREDTGRSGDDMLVLPLLLLLSKDEAASMDDGNADQTEQINRAAVPTVPAPRGGPLFRRLRLSIVHLRTVCTISAAIKCVSLSAEHTLEQNWDERMRSSRGRYCVWSSTVYPGSDSISVPVLNPVTDLEDIVFAFTRHTL